MMLFYTNMFNHTVSDIIIPSVDGFEFARNVCVLNPMIPILCMAVRDDFEILTVHGLGYKAVIK